MADWLVVEHSRVLSVDPVQQQTLADLAAGCAEVLGRVADLVVAALDQLTVAVLSCLGAEEEAMGARFCDRGSGV
ncbi:hypothetical protein ADL00_04360 [Streptomyces sp. AS58]|uniref:Uncharacterized protein n=1 Tax=Streptomyces cadmiisoli TaxID=2184053 RepID=A0A2Z4JB62_9ACTN|nr:hypothetical protein DN051_37205 [Streptomyces cadmiisoli]KOV73583.1 hypothetical protein ADL00_04360 [Streptomyces sp. AS58]